MKINQDPTVGRRCEQSSRVRRQRILVAEDDPASFELLRVFLELQGYEVAAAPDGNRAIAMGGSGGFDLLILDVHMPVYGGVEVLQMLRKRHVLHPIKVIALTADSLPEVRNALEVGGIDSYLTKPVALTKLHAEVRRLLADKEAPLPAVEEGTA